MTLVMASGGERHIQSPVLWAGFKPVTLAFAETTTVRAVHIFTGRKTVYRHLIHDPS